MHIQYYKVKIIKKTIYYSIMYVCLRTRRILENITYVELLETI